MRGFSGDGQLARLLRAHDWSATPLGDPQTWPEEVRVAVDAVCAVGDHALGGIAHALRNALVPMMTALQMIRDTGATPELAELLDHQMRHMTQLIDGLAPRPAPQQAPRTVARKVRVLVVDDNAAAAQALQLALALLGCEVSIAHDGPSALALAEQVAPEVAVLDLGLPGSDGVALGAQLRARGSLALIAVTGHGADGDRERTHEAGFADHLIKPVDLKVLHRAILRAAASDLR